MNTIREELDTTIKGDYDIIVAGGGPAGVGAAVAAGRTGARTLLIEKFSFAGGQWTAGLVNPVFDYRNKKGIMREIQQRLEGKNVWGGFFNSSFQYEYMKKLLDEMLAEAGVTVLYDTKFSRALTVKNKVNGVVAENKGGRSAFLSKVAIDCTGDADVAASAGAHFHVGREADGKVQAKTLMFTVGNISFDQTDCNTLYNLMRKAKEEHSDSYEIPYDRPYIISIPGTNTAVVQLTHMRGYNPLDGSDLSQAFIEGRRQAVETVEFWHKYIPEFRDVILLQTAPLLGVRESRQIVGEYTLTAEDLSEGRKFDDSITNVTFNMDIHEPDSTSQSCLRTLPYQIPYRCLIPKKIDGLLVAGRCISGTHEAMSSYRVTGNCTAMGEAAGYAAYEAIKQDKDLRDVQVHEILRHIDSCE
ncbi:MAG: FAD-dependent oxidoreductase [Eubacteriales bacterium]